MKILLCKRVGVLVTGTKDTYRVLHGYAAGINTRIPQHNLWVVLLKKSKHS